MTYQIKKRRSIAAVLLASGCLLAGAAPMGHSFSVANAQGQAADSDRGERGRQQQRRYHEYYRQPDIYYSAPPVYYPPPVYYAPQGPSLSLSFPLWR